MFLVRPLLTMKQPPFSPINVTETSEGYIASHPNYLKETYRNGVTYQLSLIGIGEDNIFIRVISAKIGAVSDCVDCVDDKAVLRILDGIHGHQLYNSTDIRQSMWLPVNSTGTGNLFLDFRTNCIGSDDGFLLQYSGSESS